MEKIKLFTHTDLDGIGCAILGIKTFGIGNIDIEYCDYNNINTKIEKFYGGSAKNIYDKIFITDISVNDETAQIIEYYKDNRYYPKTILLDHHATALELNKYNWATVKVMLNNDEKTSGTRMFLDYLANYYSLKLNISMYSFAEIVRKYDTWQWSKENNKIPKQWNDLFYIMGRDEFIDSIIYRLDNYDTFGFCDFDLKLLKYRKREIDNYIKSKDEKIKIKNILGYNAGVVFGEQFHSELGNSLCKLHPELDFIVIINIDNAISYRSIGNKLDLGKDIASIYGGGGHPNASGSPIAEDIKERIINLLFNK